LIHNFLSLAEWLAVERAVFLVFPTVAAIMLVVICKPNPREATGAMVGFLWQLPALMLLNLTADALGWWHFNVSSNQVAGLPIDVWIGWALWWGPVAVFLMRWIPLWAFVAVSVVIDLVTMPLLSPLVTLGGDWLIGEFAAMLCLVLGLYAAILTSEDRLPKRRAMFHVLGWGGYMVMVLPVSALSYMERPLSGLYRLPSTGLDGLLVLIGLFLLFIGVAATAEFARAGDGTPIPYDPPKSVVATGPYAFNANPMQIISAAFMGVLALYANSWGLAYIALMFLVFDAIYASEYNRQHIAKSMPHTWSSYRGEVADWNVRWTPRLEGNAEVVIASHGPAAALWKRIWPRMTPHLKGIIHVKTEPNEKLKRLVYRRPSAGIEETGVRAAGRILEHGPLPLAICGWLLRFPYFGGGLDRLTGLIIYCYRRAF
jgi:hypothetical protein